MLPVSDLTVVVVSYNSFDTICSCMSDLLACNDFNVIVVDNASPDKSGQRLKEKFTGITVLQSAQNLGYGRAANLALNAATTSFLLLLNPDLKISPADVRSLYQRVIDQRGSVALMAPAVSKKDHVHQGLIAKKWVIGAAMMMDVEKIRKVGCFDENIFLFAEETDLCHRIHQAGLRILLDSDLYVEHLYRQSSTPDQRIEDLKNWHSAWSKMYVYAKHGMAKGKKNPYRVLCQYSVKYLLASKPHKRALYKARMKGVLAFIRGEKAFLANGLPQCLPS